MALVKQLKMNHKNKKKGFIVMFLGTLAVSLLGNMLTGKGVRRVVTESFEHVEE